MKKRGSALLLMVAILAAACADSSDTSEPPDSLEEEPTSAGTGTESGDSVAADPDVEGEGWPRPDVPAGPVSEQLDLDLAEAVSLDQKGIPAATLTRIAESGDPRAAWVVVDLIRFLQGSPAGDRLAGVFSQLTGAGVDPSSPWSSTANQMIAWDLPAPEKYLDYKRHLYSLNEPRWEPFFEEGADVDWRHVGWGGVLVDDRPLGDPNPCEGSCIPSLDDPAVTDAESGDWYPEDAIVFGLEVNGEARAYPRNIMEVHEMVNDELGGRRIGVPYCTLCGSAQAYYLDNVEGFSPVLRTSGLLIRSNKMMFDLETYSLIDTFIGKATTGPLAEADVQLEQISIVTSTWGEWKEAHPDTTIVAEDGGIGRTYRLDPLGGRDNDGPVFPIGDVDPRLPVQETVLGIITDDGTAVGIQVSAAVDALGAGDEITIGDITLELDGGGVRAVRTDGTDAGGHQAFWFAWSQFHPETQIWPADFQ